MQATSTRPNYGIDAPGLFRFFFLGGSIALAIWTALFYLPFLGSTAGYILKIILGFIAFYLLGMGVLMLYGSKVMKLKDAADQLNRIPWTGTEQVLDVGCGRGLVLILAAKRLTTGTATGIDLWLQKDQADNHFEATLANAAIEGVSDKIAVQTADMRALPFPDQHFDVILSNWVVDNLPLQSDREKALDEMIRVLKPNGHILIGDIEKLDEYAAYFRQAGMTDVTMIAHSFRNAMLSLVSFGSFAPAALLVKAGTRLSSSIFAVSNASEARSQSGSR